MACGLLLVIVAAAFAVLLVAIDGMRDSATEADHSQAELTAANALERRIVDLESGARGFVITRRERFLGRGRPPGGVPRTRGAWCGSPTTRASGGERARSPPPRSYVSDYSCRS